MVDGHQLVFIGGLHRSGTSLIHRALADHPAASGFANTGAPEDEGIWLQDVIPPDRAHGGPGLFAFAPEARRTSFPEPAAARDRLLECWGRYWDTNKSCWLEKSPGNLIRARALQQLFPDARFIFVLRHPVVIALATQKWTPVSLPVLIENTLRCYDYLYQDLPHLTRATVLRYEDFVATPQAGYDALCDFAGLARCPLRQEVRGNVNAAYARLLAHDPGLHRRQQRKELRGLPRLLRHWRRQGGSWLNRHGWLLSSLPLEGDYLAEMFEARLNRYGYTARDLNAVRPIAP